MAGKWLKRNLNTLSLMTLIITTILSIYFVSNNNDLRNSYATRNLSGKFTFNAVSNFNFGGKAIYNWNVSTHNDPPWAELQFWTICYDASDNMFLTREVACIDKNKCSNNNNTSEIIKNPWQYSIPAWPVKYQKRVEGSDNYVWDYWYGDKMRCEVRLLATIKNGPQLTLDFKEFYVTK